MPVPLMMEITYYYFPEHMDVADSLADGFKDDTPHFARVQRIEVTVKLEDQGLTTYWGAFGWPLTRRGEVERDALSQRIGMESDLITPYLEDSRARASAYLRDNAAKIDHEVGLT